MLEEVLLPEHLDKGDEKAVGVGPSDDDALEEDARDNLGQA